MNKLPKPYGWIAVGRFFTDRQAAISAAEKTPVIDVWCHSQLHALAAQRDEGLAREAELRGEIERFKGLPYGQILAEAAAKHLLHNGAENFVGEVFTIDADDGQTQFEIVVTTQKVGAKSPGEVCNELQQRLAEAERLLRLFRRNLNGGGDHLRGMEHGEAFRAVSAFLASPGCADGEKSWARN